jgi:uncharacterized repeat protein (TIGR02543 family)
MRDFETKRLKGTGESPTVALNAKATEPDPAPTKTGNDFLGWFAEGATAAFDFNTAITADVTLTAGWSQKAVKMVVGGETSYYDTLAAAVAAAPKDETLATITLTAEEIYFVIKHFFSLIEEFKTLISIAE